QFTNNFSQSVTVNTSLFALRSIEVDQTYQVITASAGESEIGTRICQSSSDGLAPFWLTIQSFNTTEHINPLLIKIGVLISNITYTITRSGSQVSVEARLVVGRASTRDIDDINITYDDGSGPETVEMINSGGGYFFADLGNYEIGTNITVTIQCLDTFNVLHTLESQVTATEGESTDSTGPMYLAIVLVGVVIIAIVGIVLVRRHFKNL
ncbi:MAG: hypothetical protein RTU30_13895, partial [Candidatus Thorarchaeota archaeon]